MTVNTESLFQVESRVLPNPLVDGKSQHENLSDYYVSENRELAYRFEQAREAYDKSQPFQMVTLIAGDAGVGKTFLKRQVFSESYDPKLVCRFDVREFYESKSSKPHVELRPDLYSDDVVICSLPAMRNPKWQGLYKFLNQQSASFFVIDSLDEVHPDDYVALLEQVDRFVFEGDREFVHVVVLGRGIAFRDYWEKSCGHFSTKRLNLYMLEMPSFQTTGDLDVSTWNYHRFAHNLSWKQSDESFSLADFREWSAANFSREGRFKDVFCSPANAIDPKSESAIEAFTKREKFPQSALRNLAGNGFLRTIVAEHARNDVELTQSEFMKEYFRHWLMRDTNSGKRPSAKNPKHLSLYVQLLEELAAKVLHEGRIDSHGFFSIHDDDMVEVWYEGKLIGFPARRILDRSGLKHLDPRTPGDSRYRFEPIWLHRMLVESRNQRISDSTSEGVGLSKGGNRLSNQLSAESR